MKNLKQIFLAVTLALLFVASASGADKYAIDGAHTYIGFSIKHMMISNVKGRFKDFTGTLMVDEKDLSKCSADVTVQLNSIDTDNENRDKHLRGGDFFDAEKFPVMTLKTTKIRKVKKGYVAAGNLTIRDVTKQVEIPFTVLKITDLTGKMRLGIEGELMINRQDYGVKWNKALDKDGVLVGNDVKIELVVEAVRE